MEQFFVSDYAHDGKCILNLTISPTEILDTKKHDAQAF